MKIKILFLIVLIVVFSCISKVNKNDLKEFNLKGNVLSVKETPYAATEKFGEIVKVGTANSFSRFYTFNKYGKFDKTTFYYSEGSPFNIFEYKYDQKGYISEVLKVDDNIDLNTKCKYKYDEVGNLIEMNTFDKNQNLIEKRKCENDEKGNLVKEFNYNSDGNLTTRTEYENDINGNRIKWTDYDNKDVVLTIYEVKYDEKGNFINVLCTMPYFISYKIDCKYEFDEKSNWIKKIEIKDGKPNQITERVITYYN